MNVIWVSIVCVIISKRGVFPFEVVLVVVVAVWIETTQPQISTPKAMKRVLKNCNLNLSLATRARGDTSLANKTESWIVFVDERIAKRKIHRRRSLAETNRWTEGRRGRKNERMALPLILRNAFPSPLAKRSPMKPFNHRFEFEVTDQQRVVAKGSTNITANLKTLRCAVGTPSVEHVGMHILQVAEKSEPSREKHPTTWTTCPPLLAKKFVSFGTHTCALLTGGRKLCSSVLHLSSPPRLVVVHQCVSRWRAFDPFLQPLLS